MSIQRHTLTVYLNETDFTKRQVMEHDDDGRYVTYADHVAEVERVREKQQARDYATLWSRLMLEDKKYAAALARAALVIRGRLTDADVQRITGSPTCLHQWEDVGRSKKDDAVEAMRAACIAAVEADLTARIERDLSEGDSDGLVGGMAYALEKAIAALREVPPCRR